MICKQPLVKMAQCARLGRVLVAIAFLPSLGIPALGQSLRVGDAKFAIVPRDGDTPIPHSRSVMFQGASEWFKANNPAVEDFASIERVEVEYGLSVQLSRFIAEFPRLKRLYVGEMPSEFDFGMMLKPFADAKNLRSLEIANVCVDYRDLTIVGEFKGLLEFTCDVLLSENELRALQKLRNLRYLDIMSVVNDTRTHALQFPRLKELRIATPKSIACFDETTPIEKLVVSTRCSRDDIIRISRFGSLKEVDLTVARLDDLQPLAAAKNLRKLTIKVGRE